MAKSLEVQLNEMLCAMSEAQLNEFYGKRRKGSPISEQCALANNIAPITEAARRTIRKHNGRSDNSGEEIRESTTHVTEADNKPFAKADRLMLDFMESRGQITAEQKRIALGLPPAEFNNLSESQKKEYRFARACNISEADALRLARMNSRNI